jgi:hypothetical protein
MTDQKQVFFRKDDFYASLGSATMNIVEVVLRLDQRAVIDRLWKKDYTIWSHEADEIQSTGLAQLPGY